MNLIHFAPRPNDKNDGVISPLVSKSSQLFLNMMNPVAKALKLRTSSRKVDTTEATYDLSDLQIFFFPFLLPVLSARWNG